MHVLGRLWTHHFETFERTPDRDLSVPGGLARLFGPFAVAIARPPSGGATAPRPRSVPAQGTSARATAWAPPRPPAEWLAGAAPAA